MLEGDHQVLDDARIWDHIKICKRCFDVYRDSCVNLGLWLAGESDLEPKDDLIRAGAALAHEGQSGANARAGKNHPKFPFNIRKIRRLSLAAVIVAVVVLAATAWLGNLGQRSRPGLSDEFLAPVRAAVETASTWGTIVLPGGERFLELETHVYRSGYVPLSEPLESSLDSLYVAYRGPDRSSDVAYWLGAGMFATGQIDLARTLVDDAMADYPDDPRIATLEALIAYTEGDHKQAEALFENVLDSTPHDPVAGIDYAVVLVELGKHNQARAVLNDVVARHPGTPLAQRANSILLDIEARK
jgi:tetratricopeptide (TPR) repeat protein